MTLTYIPVSQSGSSVSRIRTFNTELAFTEDGESLFFNLEFRPRSSEPTGSIFYYDLENVSLNEVIDDVLIDYLPNEGRQFTISIDGRYIAYANELPQISNDTNGKSDIYLFDRISSNLQRVSVAVDGFEGRYDSDTPMIASDGSAVAFASSSTFTINDDPSQFDRDLFLRDLRSGSIQNFDEIVDFDIDVDAEKRADFSASGDFSWFGIDEWRGPFSSVFVVNPNDREVRDFGVDFQFERLELENLEQIRVTEDGNYMFFVAGVTEGNKYLFKYDIETGVADEVLGFREDGRFIDIKDISVSADGRYVAFSSISTDFGVLDTNGYRDIYILNTITGEVDRVSETSDGGQFNDDSRRPTISPDGSRVAFLSEATNFAVAGEDLPVGGGIFVVDGGDLWFEPGIGQGLSVQEAQTVAYLYEAALNRDGNIGLEGLNFWIDSRERGLSEERLAELFLEAPEFRANFGEPYDVAAPDYLTDRALVEVLYRNVLNREGEEPGIQFWTNAVGRENYSRANLLLAFAESPENVAGSSYVEGLLEIEPGEWGFEQVEEGEVVCKDAIRVEIGIEAAAGSIVDAGEIDCFVFSPGAGRYSISTGFPLGFPENGGIREVEIDVVSSSGELILDGEKMNATNGEVSFIIPFDPQGPGEYYVKVQGSEEFDFGDYRFAIFDF